MVKEHGVWRIECYGTGRGGRDTGMYEVWCCCSGCDFARRLLSSGFEVELLVVIVINGVG